MKSMSEYVFILTTMAVVAIPGRSSAMPPLAEVLEAARERAFDARLAAVDVDRAQADRAEATSRLLPSFTAGGTFAHNQYDAVARVPTGVGTFQEATFVATNQLDASLALEVPLVDLAAIARLRGRRAQLDATRMLEQATLLEVERRALLAYYDLAAGIALVESAERAEAVARESLRILQVRLAAGLASELDAARSEAEAERRAQTAAEARRLRGDAERRLELLVGTDVDVAPIPLEASLEPEPPLATWLERAGGLPDVRSAEAVERAARADRAAARAAYLPTLSAVASERFTSAPGFGEQPSYQISLRAQLRLDFGIVARARAADATLEGRVIGAERALVEASAAIASAFDAVEASRQRLVAARAARAAAERAVNVARTGRDAGTITPLELLEAERDQFSAEVSALEAEAALEAARGQLRLLAGESPR